MKSHHKNYWELILFLALTDFKLRYQGSALGYIWAILKPLLLFTIMNFVFSSIFNIKNDGTTYYSLQLITGLLMFTFFAEGTSAGLSSLVSKAQLVKKIYIPRWTIIIASTINSLFVFLCNIIVLAIFYFYFHLLPSFSGILLFFAYVFCLYIIIVAFSFIFAPIFVRFIDLSMIWEVATQMLMYASPIVYPLSLLPENIQRLTLINPIAFIIHFSKQGLIFNHFATPTQFIIMVLSCIALLGISLLIYRKTERGVAEYM